MVVNDLNIRLELDEEEEQSSAEKLYMFLHNAKAHHRSAELFQVFNPEFPFEKIMDSCRLFLAEREQEYANSFSSNAVIVDGEQYIHISEFSADAVVKRKVNRCLEKMPSFVSSRTEDRCPLHSKRCRLVRYMYGFLCFLHLLTEEAESAELPTTVAPLEEEGGDEEIVINPAEERAIVLFVLPIEEASATPRENEQGDLPLPAFPSFLMMDDLDYVLLTNIMHAFDIRKDYCLSAISSFCKADMDWLDHSLDKHLLVDSSMADSEYRSSQDIIKDIFYEWSSCQASLPSASEHVDATDSLGLTNMGKFQQPAIHEDSRSAISLWTRSSLEANENQKVFVYDDEFLRRAGGSRQSSSNSTRLRNVALAQYMKNFHHRKILIFHKEFTEGNAKFPLFAFKVLSRFCGGFEIALNAEKVILVEKQFALRAFGQGPGCQALRSSYYLAYSAAAIAAGIKDREVLPIYGKRDMLRSKKSPAIQAVTVPRIELPTEEDDDKEPGRPPKRIKPASPSNLSSPSHEA